MLHCIARFEMTNSDDLSGSGSAAKSAHTARKGRNKAERRRNCANIICELSRPMTCALRNRVFSSALVRPVPQPRSTIRCGASR